MSGPYNEEDEDTFLNEGKKRVCANVFDRCVRKPQETFLREHGKRDYIGEGLVGVLHLLVLSILYLFIDSF